MKRGLLARTLAASLLCAAVSSCLSAGAGSGLVGRLGGFGRGAQVKADGIRGVILDVTGTLAAVQDESSRTIFMVAVPEDERADLAPGLTVEVTGSMKDGILRAHSVRVSGGDPWPEAASIQESADRIQHVLFLLQENHSFDNYFGAFPGADGLPSGVRVEGVAPFHLPSARTGNLPHGKYTVLQATDGGSMDRFVSAEHSNDTMGFYDGTDIPNYWKYARSFTLADRFFCSSIGPSLPNHLFALAASAGDVESNSMKPPRGGYGFPCLPERLQPPGVSWRVYDGGSSPGSFSPLDPFPGFSSFMEREALRSGLVGSARLFQDLRSGRLRQVGWIFPDAEESEHPLTDIRVGMWYVTAVVNALMKSPYWPTTVLVISWDEYGGFYDHVPPPRVDAQGYGIRVPALIISSRARAGYVDHATYDFSSVLKLVETRFGVAPLSDRDANAKDIGESLDLSQPPRPPLLIGTVQ